MSPRTGRPPVNGESRKEKLNIRLTKEEKDRIDRCAEELRISRTDTIMKGIGLVEDEIGKK
ncbi:CopG family transcriptional regulator [Blautia faecis]|uniref:CopG family transcriptional regulator n=1 Tax=Blautia faecis TaxID=871665 RepID=UPI002108C5B7|nr:CopG family transcriptional regulator [Blautia faecis]MCQ4933794.1 CopG family transcriptional regulator [Blautia faecis]